MTSPASEAASAGPSSPLSAAVHVGLILGLYAALALPFLPGRLSLDNDSYFYLRQTEFFAGADRGAVAVEGGRIMDSLSYYPTGRDWLGGRERILLPRVLGLACRGLGALAGRPLAGERLETAFVLAEPVLAGLFILCAYILARRLIGASGALWAGLLLAGSPALFSRMWPGSCSKEALAMPLIVSWLYAAVRGLKARTAAAAALWAGGAGLLLVLAGLAWDGNKFFIEVFALCGLAALPLAAPEQETPWGWPFIVVSAWLWSRPLSALGSGGLPPLSDIHAAALAAVAAFWLVACLLPRLRRDARARTVWLIAGAAAAGFVLLRYEGSVLGMLSHLHRDDFRLTRWTVLEYRPATLRHMAFLFGPALVLALFGGALSALRAWRRGDPGDLLLAVWLLLGLAGTRAAVRLALPAAFAVAACAALVCVRLRTLGRRARFFSHAALAAALILSVAQTMFLENVLARTLLPRARAWRQAGSWLRAHTPADAVMLAWWDEGYFLQTLARRATIVDPGNGGPAVAGGARNRNVDVARMLLGDEASLKALIRPYNPQGRPLYVVVTSDDLDKRLVIAAHAGEPWLLRAKTGSGPLLARLLPASAGGLGTPPPCFERVYGQDGIFAYRYRPAPDG